MHDGVARSRAFGRHGGGGVHDDLSVLHAAGWYELALGVSILDAPIAPLLVAAGVWKIGTEALRIAAGEPIWEFIERGAAYAAPVLLILLQRCPRTPTAR